MRQKLILLWLAACWVLAGCALLPGTQPAATATPLTSGVEGQTWLGPQCPVVQVDTPCPDLPYADATLAVLDASGKEIARLHTDAQGQFQLLLAPGTYTLRPMPPENMPLPFAPEQTFTVVAGQFTALTILYDSGIR